MKSFILPDNGTSISGNEASLNIVVHEVINFNHLTIQEKNKITAIQKLLTTVKFDMKLKSSIQHTM